MALDPIEAEMARGAAVVYREKLVSRGVAAITSAELQSYRGGPPVAVVVKWMADGDARAFAIPSADPKALLDAIEGVRTSARIAAEPPAIEAAPSEAEAEEEDDAEEARAAR